MSSDASVVERVVVFGFAALLCVAVWASVIAVVWTTARWIVGGGP